MKRKILFSFLPVTPQVKLRPVALDLEIIIIIIIIILSFYHFIILSFYHFIILSILSFPCVIVN